MTKLEIAQRIVNNHNRIAQIVVSGDSAILLGDTLKDMRMLLKDLQADLEAEDAQAQAQTDEKKDAE